MTKQNRVTVNLDDKGIATVSLNRPDKGNALDMPMFDAICATIKSLKKDKRVRVIILQGNGDNFCTGLDVKSVLTSSSNGIKLLAKWSPFIANKAQYVCTGWREVPVPVICAIQGICWGGGLQIALGADFRIAKPDANLSIMEAKWGLIPDMGGSLPLRELVSKDVALELAMTARQISGEQAKTLGLVTHVSDDPTAHAHQLADELLNRSPDALAAVKKLYRKSWWSSAGFALFRESWYQIKVLMGKNQRIAVKREMASDNQDKKSYQNRNFS
ncbi:crotonase/enoyl-CoA hydratase family protein [Thalassotalea sp. LPB0316]|uniref:crotonase/enoyl-CoA hydratase family protein n=1 Tax=Thalassotalea sp. LPB0316 TaxID=2769490 RepID=UPI001865E338|nr:crotonase/enoyl-CoA hydratase family protein [Thalassotalea sp. LPB0316]QOL24682.1 crotonase/enoyl-CoA hydratase family protein [Thalassotalea sp. LPB0316]